MNTHSATIRSQHETENLPNFRIHGLRKPRSCCAGAMTLQTTENLANRIYQQLLPLPFDDTKKSTLVEAFTDVSRSTMLVYNDPLVPPKFEESECEQTSKLADNFSSYITDPADEHSFRNHSLATRNSES